ncbi:MAG: hypothetical protein U1F36_15405 [Planctomycetota bacterium]
MRISTVGLCCVLTTPLVAQYPVPNISSPSVATTRQDNIITNWAEIPISPLKMAIKSAALPVQYTAVVNSRRGRVELYYYNSTANQHFLVDEYPIPFGATAAVVRPNSTELWVAVPNSRIGVDPATGLLSDGGAVIVIDALVGAPVRSIAVGINPSGIAFHPSGSHAYVSCRGSRNVHVVDCALGQSIAAIDVDQYTPHAIDYLPATNEIVVASLLAGNQTVAKSAFPGGVPEHFVTNALTDPLVTQPLPDRDVVVLSVNPTNPGSVSQATTRLATGVMSTQYALTADPSASRIYVVGTQALNDQFVGEKNFVAGQVVENRLAVLDYSGGGTPTKTFVNLDASAFAPMATPTDFVVSPSARRGWLVARGVDRLVEFSLTGAVPVAVGAWDIASADPNYSASLVGARTAAVDSNGTQVTVYCEIENSFVVIDVTGGAPTTPTTVTTTRLAFDPLPAFAKSGWASLSDAKRSLIRTSSCASCHVDLGTDNLVWQLSKFHSPEGTSNLSVLLSQAEDLKSPMQTQVLFGLPEVAPYHWRGEQHTLEEFNGAFPGLLEGAALNTAELDDMVRFIGMLRHAPNRYLAMDRSYANTTSPTGAGNPGQGRIDFETFRCYGPANPASCASCHALPLGTNGEIQFTPPVGAISPFVQVAQLRGVVNRLDAPIDLGPFVGFRASNGAGLVHTGQIGSFDQFVGSFGGITGNQVVQDDIVSFLHTMDTGLAPSTSFVCVLRTDYANPSADFNNAMNYLTAEAAAGNCDFSATMSIPNGVGGYDLYFGFWDRTQQAFQMQSQAFGSINRANLQALFLGGNLPLMLVGHPPGTGQRWGIDADDDQLLDLDEVFTFATDPFDPDSDHDGRPDGHEVLHPTTPDTQPPVLPPSATVMYATDNTLKVEFNSDEPALARPMVTITIGGTPFPPIEWTGSRSPAGGGFTTNHQVVFSNLPQQIEVTLFGLQLIGVALSVQVTDPVNNQATLAIPSSPFPTTSSNIPVRVQDIANVQYVSASNSGQFTVNLGAGTNEFPLPVPGSWDVTCEVLYGTQPGGPGTQIQGITGIINPATNTREFTATVTPTAPLGSFTVPLPASAPTDLNRVLAINVTKVLPTPPAAPPAGYFYVETYAFKRNHKVAGL